MKSFFVYPNYQNNLCSIKPIEDIYPDRLFLQTTFANLLVNPTLVVMNAGRPNWEIRESLKALDKIDDQIQNLRIKEHKKEVYDISFLYRTQQDNYDFIQTAIEMWFEFEDPLFTFLIGTDIKTAKFLQEKEFRSWQKMEEIAKGYCIYKGIEEDVLWISKHTDLKFEGIIEGMNT